MMFALLRPRKVGGTHEEDTNFVVCLRRRGVLQVQPGPPPAHAGRAEPGGAGAAAADGSEGSPAHHRREAGWGGGAAPFWRRELEQRGLLFYD